MRTCAVYVAVVMLGGCTFQGSCGKKKINTKKAESLIRESLQTRYKLDRVVVHCPKDVKIEKGGEFECQAAAKGRTIKVKVTQQDDKGNVRWQTGGFMGLAAVDMVKSYLVKNLGRQDISPTCPAVPEPKPNTSFDCKAKVDGVDVITRVHMVDDKGSVNYKVADGVLIMSALELMIRENLKGKKIEAKIKCGAHPMRVAKPASTFTCAATDNQGKTATITVTIKDTAGNVSWKVTAVPK